MAPGDALYIPRGVMHDAATAPGDRSLHITLGLLEPSWAQALRSLVDAAELDDPALREALPTWRIGEQDLLPELLARLARLGGPAQMERLTTLLLGQLAHDRQPLPRAACSPRCRKAGCGWPTACTTTSSRGRTAPPRCTGPARRCR
jgi:ribosomal protein L16 Arg81 hydroxylase